MDHNRTEADESLQIVLSGKILISVLLGSIIFAGIIGNVLVTILIALVKELHLAVNLCLGCLAVVDLMVLIFVPISKWLFLYAGDHSALGRGFCKYVRNR